MTSAKGIGIGVENLGIGRHVEALHVCTLAVKTSVFAMNYTRNVIINIFRQILKMTLQWKETIFF